MNRRPSVLAVRWVVVALLLAGWALLALGWLGRVWPLLALGSAMLAFLTPGYIVSGWVVPHTRSLSLAERLPLALALSTGILALPAVILSPDVPAFGHAMLALAALFLLAGQIRPPTPQTGPNLSRGEAVALAAVIALAAALTALGPRDWDDWLYLGWVTALLEDHSGLWADARYQLNAWFVYEAAFSHLSRVPAVDIVQTILPPLLAAAGIGAFYAFCAAVCGNRRVALWAVGLQMLLYVTDLEPWSGSGRVFLWRIAQDKTVATLALLPVALYMAWRLSQRATGRALLAMMMIVLGLFFTHLQGLALFLLLGGPFLAFHLLAAWYRRARRSWLPLAAAGVAVALLVAAAWALRSTIVADRLWFGLQDLAPGTLDFFSGRRFFASSENLTILPPHLLMHPLKLLALAALPYLFWLARKRSDYRLLALSMFTPLFLLYVPWTMTIVSRAVGLLYAWRLLWFLPVGPVLAIAATHLWQTITRSRRWLPARSGWLVAALLAIGGVLVFRWEAALSYSALAAREARATAAEVAFIGCVKDTVPRSDRILAPPDDNYYLFGLIPRARVFFFHGQDRVPGGLQAIQQFYPAAALPQPPALLDDARIAILQQARYVIVPTPGPLDFELAQMPDAFALQCEGGGRRLWQVQQSPAGSPLVYGNTALAAKDWAAAATHYRAAIAAGQGHAQAWLGLAWALQQQDEIAQAEAAYRRATAMSPDAALPHLWLGRFLMAQGDDASAHQALAQAAALAPTFYPVHLALADWWLQQGQGPEASAAVRHAAQVYLSGRAWADPWRLALTMGQFYEQRHMAAEAIDAYRQAAGWADNAEIRLALARLWQEQGNDTEAEQDYLRAALLNLWEVRPYMALGALYQQQGRLTAATRAYRLALRVDYWTPAAHRGLAEIAQVQGDGAAAEREWRLALAKAAVVEPASVSAEKGLGALLAAQGRWGEAVQLYHQALAKAPDDAELRSGLAAACQQAQERQLADALLVCRSAP